MKLPRYQPGINVRNGIKLSSNEASLGPSPKVIKSIAEIARAVHRYPEHTHMRLKEIAASLHGVSPEQVIFGNGSDEIITFITHSFLNTGETVLIGNPTFSIYRIASMLRGAEVQSIPLKNWHFDLQSVLHHAHKGNVRIIFLCSPNNPTGTCISPQELRSFLQNVPQSAYIVLDEAYMDFADTSFQHAYLQSLDLHPKLIILRTMSKAYGLAGLRIGYGIANKKLIEVLEQQRMPFNLSVPALSAAQIAFEDREHYKKIVELTRRERKRLLESYGAENYKAIPSQANFITLLPDLPPELHQQFPQKNAADILFQLCMNSDPPLSIRSLSSFSLDNAVRITVGTKEENNYVLKLLQRYLAT